MDMDKEEFKKHIDYIQKKIDHIDSLPEEDKFNYDLNAQMIFNLSPLFSHGQAQEIDMWHQDLLYMFNGHCRDLNKKVMKALFIPAFFVYLSLASINMMIDSPLFTLILLLLGPIGAYGLHSIAKKRKRVINAWAALATPINSKKELVDYLKIVDLPNVESTAPMHSPVHSEEYFVWYSFFKSKRPIEDILPIVQHD